MPPRLRSPNFSSTFSPCTSTPIRTQCISQPFIQVTHRDFSQSSSRHVTARRREFYAWLNGPGRNLKEPLPGSTNYLGAYDKYGNLIRAGPGYRRQSKDDPKATDPDAPASEAAETPAEGEKTTPSGQDSMDELEMSVRRDEESSRNTKASEDPARLPPETAEDLRPFPQNRYFRSQPVLSEDLREAIYQRVTKDGASVSLASVEFGVSNERVGAVVRLKQVEKEWVAQGKKLALPYSNAVLTMLPTTPYIDPTKPENKGQRPIPHEPINDLIVHPATRQQLFVPVAESRVFTRADAGKAFDNNLLPADDRIPHPELVHAERELAAGLSFQERRKLAEERLQVEIEKKAKEEEDKARELAAQRVVPKRRWDFVFKDVSVEHAGKDGRGAKGVGWRYGFPHEDRKKGQVKIPTKVEA